MPTAGHSGTKIINNKENYYNIHVFEGLKLCLTILNNFGPTVHRSGHKN